MRKRVQKKVAARPRRKTVKQMIREGNQRAAERRRAVEALDVVIAGLSDGYVTPTAAARMVALLNARVWLGGL